MGNLNNFAPPQDSSINVVYRQDDSPFFFYTLLLSDHLLDLLVNETNIFSKQKIIDGISNEEIKHNSFLANWVDTNKAEMWLILGIIIWIQNLKDYWSTNLIHKCCINQQTGMSRNRFEVL